MSTHAAIARFHDVFILFYLRRWKLHGQNTEQPSESWQLYQQDGIDLNFATRMLQHAAFDSEGLVCFVLASPPSPLSQHLVCVPRTIMARQTPIFFRNKTK